MFGASAECTRSNALLESATVDFAEELPNTHSFAMFLEDTPSLCSLRLKNVGKFGGNLAKPWRNLSSLTMRFKNSEIEAFRFFLSNAPNLERLHIRIWDIRKPIISNIFDSDEALPLNPTLRSRPSLIYLTIANCYVHEGFLRHILPAHSLQRLNIGHGAFFSNSLAPVIDFIDQSRCELQAFGLASNYPIDMDSLHTLLARMVSLTHLITGSRSTSNYKMVMHYLPQLLNPTPNSNLFGDKNSVLPSLQVMNYFMFDMGIKSQHLIDMIKGRWNGGYVGSERSAEVRQLSKLKSVHFSMSNPKVILEALQAEVSEGLEVFYDLPGMYSVD